MADIPQIVFYHYAYSPFARRIQWYLLLRGIPYSECLQPPVIPRPDLLRLGIRHRRIPVLAIGRDVYVDSRLILRKLEQITAPSVRPPLGVGSGAGVELLALERLLDVFTVDGTLFVDAARLIPPDVPVMRDPAFNKDRIDHFGQQINGSAPSQEQDGKDASSQTPSLHRAEALAEIRHAAALLETTLLADDRAWILNTSEPSLADIEAVWPFHWLSSMAGAFLDGGVPTQEAALTPAQYPRLFAWVDRFNTTIRAVRKARPAAVRLDGQQAAAAVLAAPFYEPHEEGNGGDSARIDPSDPVARVAGLHLGQAVIVWPIDTGVLHKDIGRLVRLDANEVVLEVGPSEGGKTSSSSSGISPGVHLHAPRHGFRVRPYHENGDGARL